MGSRIRLVAFDLDGTLVRGDTVIETLAKAMGHVGRARALETFHDTRRDRESLRFARTDRRVLPRRQRRRSSAAT